jgi:hypothetical protein
MAIKVKNKEDLLDQLSEDIQWRKKEIGDMKASIEMSSKPNYLLRAGFVMLCAHFEGFIRFASNAYIAYISAQRIKTSHLKSCFSAITLRFHKHSLFITNGEKVKTSAVKQLIDEYNALLENEFILKLSDDNMPFIDEDNPAIQTDSNPSSTVLREISIILGLNYEILFQPRAPFIDGELLNPRHQIAHGRRLPIRYESYVEVHDYVLSILDEYLDAVMYVANNQAYLAS